MVIRRALGFLLLLLSPALVAIWATPWFVTQDGPAHTYNAEILTRSFDQDSPFRDYFRIEWLPIPNWLGHLLLAGFLRIMPAWAADRLMTTIPLVGFAVSILWLRWRVRGERGLYTTALLAALVSMNMCWLFGFTNFMLGACLYPLTLGVWWSGRDRPTVARLCGIATLLSLGYFCHLVTIGLTLLSLQLLALAAPFEESGPPGMAWRRRLMRLIKTSLCFLPVLLLIGKYMQISRRGGPMEPVWDHLSNVLSLQSWIVQLNWVDPLTLAIKHGMPFTTERGTGNFLFAPVLWFVAAVVVWLLAEIELLFRGIRKRQFVSLPDDIARAATTAEQERSAPEPVESLASTRRGVWLVLTGCLMLLGVISPDSLGPNHGYYLTQRLTLLALVPFACIFDLRFSTRSGKFVVGSLAVAFALQSVIVWDYAIESNRTVGQLIAAKNSVGRGQRVFALLIRTPTRFRVNPMFHGDMWLGVGTGNIFWNNYETRYYYFPVQFLDHLRRPDPEVMSDIFIQQNKTLIEHRLELWTKLLAEHADQIDVLLVWDREPLLDQMTERYFECVEDRGELRIFKPRASPADGTTKVSGPRAIHVR